MPLILSGTVTISDYDRTVHTPFGDNRVPGATVFSGQATIQLDDASVDALASAIAEKWSPPAPPVIEPPKNV